MIDLAHVVVAFDWNGTLVDDRERARLAVNRALEAQGGMPIDPPTFQRCFRLPLSRMFEQLGVAPSEAPAMELAWNQAMLASRHAPRPAVASLLDALADRGAVLGVVSAADEAVVHLDLGQPLEERFAEVWCRCQDKAAALAAVGRAWPDRPTRIFVGDSEHDIEAAHDAGWTALAVANGYRPRSALAAAAPDRILEEVTDLLQHLELFRPTPDHPEKFHE